MNLEQEILLAMKNLYPGAIIINEWEPIADILAEAFKWKGSKIDWRSLAVHVEKPINFKDTKKEKEVEEFAKESGLYKVIKED